MKAGKFATAAAKQSPRYVVGEGFQGQSLAFQPVRGLLRKTCKPTPNEGYFLSEPAGLLRCALHPSGPWSTRRRRRRCSRQRDRRQLGLNLEMVPGRTGESV